MNKSKNIFIKIDEFIFQKIDIIKLDGSFQKFNDILNSLEEDKQKIFAQVITFTFLIIPFLFVMILWFGNYKTKKNLDIKKQILDQIALLSTSKETLMNVSSAYVSPTAINGQEDLDNKMRNLMSQSNIDQAKVRIASFNQLSSSSSISKIEAVLNFNNFGTLDFSKFLSSLVDQEKFKVTNIKLIKNNETSLLQGEISLIHLGRNAGN